jgi:aromatic-amino-acid transaminase
MFKDMNTLDIEDLDRSITKLSKIQDRILLIINDPCHNPTGYKMSQSDWDGVIEVIKRQSKNIPITVLLDYAYAEFGDPKLSLESLIKLKDSAQILVAWSASKSYTHYGLRVGALAGISDSSNEILNSLLFSCRGTWSNCNNGGMEAIYQLMTTLKDDVEHERAGLIRMLNERTRVFCEHANKANLRVPQSIGGFFATVLTDNSAYIANRMKSDGVYVVPVKGALRVGVCSTPMAQATRVIEAVENNIYSIGEIPPGC